MATVKDVLKGLAAAMEDQVPELSTALPREADATDNDVHWPHGEIIIVSNIRADQWNTDLVGYETDDAGNRIGYLYDAKFNAEMQLNIWISAPSDNWDIQNLGSQLERGMRRYGENRKDPDSLPDGEGGTLTEVTNFSIVNGGTLPLQQSANPPHRGYQLTVGFSFTDRINTAEEYGEEDYVATVTVPNDDDITVHDDPENVVIEYAVN
jgi:hypothetical protein